MYLLTLLGLFISWSIKPQDSIIKNSAMKKYLKIILLTLTILLNLAACSPSAEKQKVFDITEYGAVGDGKTLDTKAIQKAIDEASKLDNGARVLVPKGHQYLIGTIVLKGNIDFHLEGDAELFVSINKVDYSEEAAVIAKKSTQLKNFRNRKY